MCEFSFRIFVFTYGVLSVSFSYIFGKQKGKNPDFLISGKHLYLNTLD